MKNKIATIHSTEAQKIKASRYDWSIPGYYQYFLNYKKSILLIAFISFAISFTFFFSKSYNTKISYNINTNQSFESNILASTFLQKSDNNVFSNLVERSYNYAKSRHFLKELSFEVLKDPENSYIYQKAIFQKSIITFFNGHESYGLSEKVLLLTDFLESKISVQLKNENQIFFSITTKDPLLTESIQKHINDNAKKLLIKDPLKEVKKASGIISRELMLATKRLKGIDEKRILIQKKYNTLNPKGLAKSYADLEANLSKDYIAQKSKLDGISNKILDIKDRLLSFENDYSLQQELSDLQEDELELKSKIDSLDKSINDIKTKAKDLPTIMTNLKTIERDEQIQLKTILKLTEQKSLANISIQKIESSISLLFADENIKSSSNIILIIKTLTISSIFCVLFLSMLYYKQSYLPVIFSNEEVEGTKIPIATTFSNFDKKMKNNGHVISSNILATKALTENISHKSTTSFIDIGNTEDSNEIVKSIIAELIDSNKTVYLLGFNFEKNTKNQLKSFNKSKSFAHNNIVEKLNHKSVLNIDKIRSILASQKDYDYILIDSTKLKSSANKALIASISDNTFALCAINETRYSQLNNFVKLYNLISNKVKSKISIIITKTKTSESITSYLNKNINSRESIDYEEAS